MILLDTGPLYASLDQNDAHHERALKFMASTDEALVAPAPIINEVCYWLAKRVGAMAESQFLLSFASSAIEIAHPCTGDYERAAEIVWEYADSNIGFVDAMVVAIGERFRLTKLATVDYRHFAIIKPKHVSRFELLL